MADHLIPEDFEPPHRKGKIHLTIAGMIDGKLYKMACFAPDIEMGATMVKTWWDEKNSDDARDC
jgi:hypothetical protein